MKTTEKDLRKTLSLKNTGGDKNYSVIAGAGAGKSTMLSKRISRQIKNGESLDSFVIITYTNAAANELRDKIGEELENMLDDPSLNPIEKNHIEDALSKIELIQISTIHAFLLQILREYAFESCLSIDAKTYEDENEMKRRIEFFDNWVNEHFKDLDKYRNDWTDDKQKDYTRDVLWGIFNDVASLREDIVIDTTDHSADFINLAKEYVDKNLPVFSEFVNVAKANVPKCKNGKDKLIKHVECILNNVSKVEENVNKGTYGIDEAFLLSEAYESLEKRIKGKEKDNTQNFYGKNTDDSMLDGLYPKLYRDEIVWNFKKYYNEYLSWSDKAAKIAECAAAMRDEYQQKTDKDTKGISNDDILYRAEKLITDYPNVLNKLREKYMKIYVDEFQDTTGSQARIIKLLAGEKGSSGSQFKPRENCLVVVGDPKQSIYRFTGAEKTVYDEVNDEMGNLNPSLGESVTLNYNFRSNKDIVEWVNSKYKTLIPSYSEMDSDWTISEKNSLHGVFKYEWKNEEGEKYTKDKDAIAVTSIIKELVSNENCFIEEYNHREKTYKLRRIQYSDFMIITRKTADMLLYVNQFNKEDIPLDVQGKFRLEDDEVIRNFIRVLSYFGDTKNGNVQISAAQIVGRTNICKDDEKEIENGKKRLKALRDEFRKNNLNTSSIVRRIIKEEGLYLPDGEFDVTRVREYRARLNQMVEACLTNNEGDIKELVKTMLSYIEKDIKKANSLVSGENAVRLMNVHQAKGLTGKIVIIADRRDEEGPRYNGFKSMGKYYPAASYKEMKNSSAKIYPTFAYDADLMEKARNEEWEECTRLEYVAATRAAHALIFMPLLPFKNVWFTDEIYGIDSLPDIIDWIDDRKLDTGSYTVENISITSKTTSSLAELDENIKKVDLDEINSAIMDSITPSSLETGFLAGYTSMDSGYIEETDRPHGNVFGTVMHRTYELIFSRYGELKDLNKIDKEKIIERIINQAILEQYPNMHRDDKPEQFFDFLVGKMKDYFDKVITPIMNNAEEIYPEYSFSFYVPNDEITNFKNQFGYILSSISSKKEIKTDNIWVNGQADLVVKQKDGKIKVYDYKSDGRNGKSINLFEDTLKVKYDGQLKLYKYAIGKAFGVEEVETEIIHLYK